MNVQWWCSAQGTAWDGRWTAYPGVWVFVLALAIGYARTVRALPAPGDGAAARDRRWRAAAFLAGVAGLWAALDWPIGPLGAGYLASMHMVQYLVIALAAPALLLLGIPPETREWIEARPRRLRVARALTHPVVGLGTFVLVTAATHVPAVVDSLMGSQIGSFAIDMAWLLSGLLFWWPVISPVRVRPALPPPLGILYLFPATLTHTAISAYLVFSRYPVYATYELAPPTGWVSALGDQQIAGGLMWVAATPITWGVIGVIFFRWIRRETAGNSAIDRAGG